MLDEHTLLYRMGRLAYKISPRTFYALKLKYAEKKQDLKSRERDPNETGEIKSVNIEVSIRCNLRCGFCWWWGEKGIGFEYAKTKDPMVTKELTLEEMKGIVDQTEKYKPTYYLSGGEPFIRKETLPLMEYINSKGLEIALTTNGTLIDDATLRRITAMKNLSMAFSIDGTKSIHDKIRGEGNFNKTTGIIKKLIEYRGKERYPIVRTNTTFSPWLVGHLKELIECLQETGVTAIHFQHLWFTDQQHADAQRRLLKEIFDIDEKGMDSHIISAPSQIYASQLADEIAAVEKTRFKVPIFIRPQMTKEQIIKYYTNLNYTKVQRCVAPWNGIIIKANGDALFCPDEWITQWRIGNVRTATIDTIWSSEKAKKFRDALNKVGLFPACARCCAING